MPSDEKQTTLAIREIHCEGGSGLPESFFEKNWRFRKPTVIRGGVAALAPAFHPDAVLATAGAPATGVVTRVVAGERLTSSIAPLELTAPLFRRMSGGAIPFAFYFSGFEAVFPPLRELVRDFAAHVPLRRQGTRLNLSPSTGAAGIGLHADFFDALMFQLSGRRRWLIWPDGMMPPDYLQNLGSNEPDLDVRYDLPALDGGQEVILEPGDILHMPALWGHSGNAIAGKDPSVSATIGWVALTSRRLAGAFTGIAEDSLLEAMGDAAHTLDLLTDPAVGEDFLAGTLVQLEGRHPALANCGTRPERLEALGEFLAQRSE